MCADDNSRSRVYLINGDSYELFKLKNMEFTFDVDVSNLPCGLNGALYFVKMDADGGLSKYPTNKAGAKVRDKAIYYLLSWFLTLCSTALVIAMLSVLKI